MIATRFYKVRQDGVQLFKTIDAKTDEYGNFIEDQNKNLIPTGYKILQLDTGILYDEAIDVENSPHVYVETEILIESEKDDNEYESKI